MYKRIKSILILSIVLTQVIASYSQAEPLRIYHIGNSLTWDSNPTTQKIILEANGYTVSQGYHIACSRGLTYITSNPDYTCVTPPEPYKKWKNALSQFEWDVITIQAYPGGNGQSEVAATAEIIEEALAGDRNENCIFFLYLAWPTVSDSENFADRVMIPFGGDDDPVFLSSGFLSYWKHEISALFPTTDIRVIPTGVAFASIDEKLREIEIAPYTNTYDLYRDIHHMNAVEGRHVAMSTMLSSITGIRTRDIIYPAGYFSSYNAEFVEMSNEVVWYTLSSEAQTKLNTEPEIGLKQSVTGQLECSFLGTLFESSDLKTWNKISNATSPHRIALSDEKSVFYRSVSE